VEEEPVQVLIVEDHAIFRELFALCFDCEPGFEVVAQAGSLAEARGLLEGVDVVVLDLGVSAMPAMAASVCDTSPGTAAPTTTHLGRGCRVPPSPKGRWDQHT
jgi:hypothetical protein